LLKIGRIHYANLYPIFYTLQKEGDKAFFQFAEGVPSELNRLLREGAIDISPSSSIEYLRHPDRYTLINGHSISSKGEIRSILLFSRSPIETLSKKQVFASGQSETSTALLRIILNSFYKLHASVTVSSLDLIHGLEEAPAYMLIGDDALRWSSRVERKGPGSRKAFLHAPAGDFEIFVYDLGTLWYERTGLPFVFALWIARRECCESEEFLRFIELLDSAKEFAVRNFEMIAKEYPEGDMIGTRELVSYWENMSFDFDDDHRKGLELFRTHLKEEGLL
jgi:chorismate dehydratase